MGAEVYEKEAKKQRAAAAEYMIRSLPHFNNEVRRYKLEIDGIQTRLEQIHAKNVRNKATGGNLMSAKPYETQLGKCIKDLEMYESITSKIYDFLNSLDKEDKRVLIDLFVNNKTYENVALSVHMTKQALHKNIKRILSNFY